MGEDHILAKVSVEHWYRRERCHGVREFCDTAPVSRASSLLAACPKNLLSLRDRALILVGFAGAFQRSELCAMTVSDLCFSASGLVINVPRSKADQERAGERLRSYLASTRIPAR